MSWRGLDHRTIYEMIVSGWQGPGMSMEVERLWAEIQDVVTIAESGIAAALRVSQAEWEGAGKESMRGTNTRHVAGGYAVLGTWDDGRSVDDDESEAVDRLMVDYESASQHNESRFDIWSVPPTVAVSTASAAPGGAEAVRAR